MNMIEPLFMQRAMDLALNGLGQVSPNPLVGCVIVHKGIILAEGWHEKYGGPHAEVMALGRMADESLFSECDVYVNLEPCAHFGKTPPCADLLIEKKVGRVIIANKDPNPLVAGQGILKLRDAGIEVVEDVLWFEGRHLNRRFFTSLEKERPYIILKWAQTADGFIARPDGSSKWISNELSRALVHKWRTEEDAVLVGTRTAEIDNPRLTVRNWTGRNPLRVVFDRFGNLPESLHLFDGEAKTLLYSLVAGKSHKHYEHIRIPEPFELHDILKDLLSKKIQSIIIEGGASTLNLFIKNKLWDEARIFTASHTFKKGLNGPQLPVNFIKETLQIETDILDIYLNQDNHG
jgi:diaminohydroxyphosphoribosylaminopyrimidine deaminase/5-amino-6-(5-phosphoribosylamino)uracil reductase